MNKFGFVRVSVCSPVVTVGNPRANVDSIITMLDQVQDSDVVLFPELSISGYTCGDLFQSQHLMTECVNQIFRLQSKMKTTGQMVIVGAPITVDNQLFNCGIALTYQRILGIVPKQNIPNYKEFYESRWFQAANGSEPEMIKLNNFGPPIPFGTDLLFESHPERKLIVGIEVCEDLWMPIPPSSYQCLAGANLLCNLSASNETVGKNEYRAQLVENQSGRCVAAYAYASAGPSESTSDLVFGGHSLIAENGHILAQSSRVGDPENPVMLDEQITTADIDMQKIQIDRRNLTSFRDASGTSNRTYRFIQCFMDTGFGSKAINANDKSETLKRHISGTPFVPDDEATLKNRCAEVFGIQCAGLAGRLKQLSRDGVTPNVYIGISGGLDSTLALLVAVKAFEALKFDLKGIHGITMPGFGTTEGTRSNATSLMELLEISSDEIDIRPACLEVFKSINHKPFGIDIHESEMDLGRFLNRLDQLSPEIKAQGDLVFENVQARQRTLLLMSKGFVLGTGDLSEAALGWCTYNGDHMSMYNVNCSIPKTLVKFLVRYVAESVDYPNLHRCLMSIYDTTISPELLPTSTDGKIEQSTEDIIGPYELHDFFLLNFVRNGFSPEKILFLSDHAHFTKEYSRKLREETLRTFIKRFFSQQFKRNCVPDGPKVGSVSLSPRGDWRMPSDASAQIWLENVK